MKVPLTAHVLSLALVLLYLFLSPLILAYMSLVCVLSWFLWVEPERDVLVIHNGSFDGEGSMSEILSIVKDRAFLMDYADYKHWPRFSLSTQLFHCFGSHPIPQFFMPRSLPAVIVVKKFRWPRKITFGASTTDREKNFAELKSEVR